MDSKYKIEQKLTENAFAVFRQAMTDRIYLEVKHMNEFSKAGYHSAQKTVAIGKSHFIIENLSPDKTDECVIKAAEEELYDVFSKYKKHLDKE
ncbi:hypothetical protein [Ruminococcus flavefaciens]|uniref:hypothetical protein n=2 Tax=Ruminococcus flavefaciens TaxID=1265 RepID=UPI00055C263A|nr:hypothetical protein [Ruminococcus flavefaciens]